MLRLLVGLVKGLVLGGGVGVAAHVLGLGGAWGYVAGMATGFAVGLLVGRPIWRHAMDPGSTIITGVLKALFGAGIGALAFYVLGKMGGFTVHVADLNGALVDLPVLWAPALGAIYGAFVEVDDSTAGRKGGARAKAKKSKNV